MCIRDSPISILNGIPLTTRKTIGIVKFGLFNSSETCFLTVLFCFPVAPIMIMLLIGNVGIGSLQLAWIHSSSVRFTREMFDPVSIMIMVIVPFTVACM